MIDFKLRTDKKQSEVKDRTPHTFPLRRFVVVMTLTLVMLVFASVEVWLQHERMERNAGKQVELQEVNDSIIYLDEVLTMSARMAASTGELQWEERYRNFEPKLDAAIKRLIEIAPEAYEGQDTAKVDVANVKLIELENKAFELVREGHNEKALKLLHSSEYEANKNIYAKDMERVTAFLSSNTMSNRKIFHNSIVQTTLFLGTVTLILAFAWPFVLLQMRKHIMERKETEQSLRHAIAENERENWLKAGLGELNETIRGEQDAVDLAQKIIAKLADYLNASVGAIYLREDDDTLRMIGSYAYSKRKHISNDFKLGQGLVGQAALEKKSILVTEVPDDYTVIRSGLGEAHPRNILVQPFLYENKLTGVIELGSFDKLSDLQLAFLEKASESIAIAIDSALSRTRMTELLEETQRQSEQLQNQQEELRATNEELEQQTEKLKKSEEVLKTQQEELESSNSELEEKTVALEEQKQELENSWNQIKGKSKELELASKYKSEFLSNVSHELRTPLNSMLILARMLADNEQGNLSDDQVESAQVILEGGTELLSLINEILDLSKVEAGKMDIDIEQVDLSELIEDLKKNFEHVASDKGLEFTVGISDEVPPAIISDQKRVKQVLKNFLSNAFKFTEKGSVTLNISRPGAGVDLSTSGLRTDNSIAISVTDTGIGIDKDNQKTVLEAFQQANGTTNRIYGGTGLGLAIANRFAELLGGEMQLESSTGKGSTFTLYLPHVLEAGNGTKKTNVSIQNKLPVEIDEQDENASKVSEPVPLTILGAEIVPDDRACIQDGDKVILIIEDDARFAKILVDISGERGFKCIVAGDGQSGLKFAFEYLPVAVILDIGLPDMDGMKVMDAIKEDPRTRHIPVHFISARDQAEVGAEAMSKGAIGYLTKPVSKEMLDKAFSNIQHFITEDIKKLLVVEDDSNTRKSVIKLIGSDDVEIQTAATGKEAYGLLTSQEFDCMVLDLGLPDMSGFELLNQIKDDQAVLSRPPVIVYSGKELSRAEHAELQEYTGTVIVKGAESPARLLDETSLFLHRVETSLPVEQQRMIRTLHEKDSVLNSKKVLIVDDDMRNIFALSHALKSKGMVVLRAENGSEALTVLDENPDVDIVLMDIMMPVMDGFEAMRKIREHEKFWKLPILALTAKAMKGDKEKCIEAGANDYLAKPVDIEKVLSMLRVWLYL